MQFSQLFCFAEAVKYKSISVAAEKNYTSQSSFSSSISRLEKELGVCLLKRTNTGIQPTDYGKHVLEQAEKIFEAQENIVKACQSESFSSSISINCIAGIYYQILPEAIRSLHSLKSNITLNVMTNESLEISRNVSSGYADLGILIRGDYLSAFKDLNYTPLFKDEYHLYVGRNSSLWERKSIALDELKQQNYIAYRDEFRKENGGLTNMFKKEDFPNIVFCTDDLDFMKQMIAKSDYVAFFPKFMASEDFYLDKGLIRGIPIEDYDLTFEVGYVESRKYRVSFQEKAVIEVLKKTVELHLKDCV